MGYIRGLKRIHKRDLIMIVVGAVIALGCVEIVSFIYNARTPIPYQSAGINSPWIPPTVKHWSYLIDPISKEYNIDPNFVAIIMTMESGGDSKVVSEDNAVGLMQITAPTAQTIAKSLLKSGPISRYNLNNPRTNIEFGVAYLAWLRNQFGEANQGPSWVYTTELVADGYNGGPGAANSIEAGKGLTDTQTVVYSRDAFNMWREIHAKDSPTFDRWKERGGQALLDDAQANNQ
jgi:soluble lytic murein transglycosylase-like protein